MKKFLLASILLGSSAFALPNPSWVFCLENGGTYETRTATDGNQDGVCIFNQDGITSECGGWAYFRGDCKPGDCAQWSIDTHSCEAELNRLARREITEDPAQ